ncbi:unnamed protein product, partial [Staurois parvus]
MQTASTNICERMSLSQELNGFKRGTVIGCHLCNKSIHEISLPLKIPWSTVSGILTKWKQLGTTAIQPEVSWVSAFAVRRTRQLSAESIAKDLQTSRGLHISTTKVHKELMEWGS